MDAVTPLLAETGLSAPEVTHFAHGMTVATNALLEQRGARTALLTTRGFEDVLEIGRQSRPELYKPCVARPEPLVPPELRFGVVERASSQEVIQPLTQAAIEDVLERLSRAEVEAVAVCLLHSYACPDNERLLAAAVRRALPHLHVSVSSELLSVFREFERTSTTVIDAYLSPLLGNYLEKLARRAADAGLPEPEIMQSNGGLIPLEQAARHAAWTVLSGPAAGSVAAAQAAVAATNPDALSFDMGGTSCDVAVIEAGEVATEIDREIDGRALQLPSVDVHTVGAGGGSIAWVDPGGALRVGPRSAGSKPGPACYGNGGREPTVTDANLLLGYLGVETQLAGGLQLDIEAARTALQPLAHRIGVTIEEAAEGVLRVADQEMLHALGVVTVERGVDPRSRALVAFGGAGPMHAARIAAHLEVERVLCPGAAGVLSAVGLIGSDRRRDFARTVLIATPEMTREGIVEATNEVASHAETELPGATRRVSYDMRYRGQSFDLQVEATDKPEPEQLRSHFDEIHAEHYGFSDPEADVEIVNIRVSTIEPRPRPPLETESRAPTETTRDAIFDGERVSCRVLHGALLQHDHVEGPAVIETGEATIVVPPGWSAGRDGAGTTVLEATA